MLVNLILNDVEKLQSMEMSAFMEKTYKARFHHYGAMIDEMRLLVRYYEPNLPKQEWVQFVINHNLLGKASRMWVRELITGVFYPRFVNGQVPNVVHHLKILENRNVNVDIIRSIMYFHTALNDVFLYDFVTLRLFEKYYSGQVSVSARDVYQFILETPPEKFNNPWSDYIKHRLSRGVMATLRDFGILEGKARKQIANYHLPLETFVYVAFILNEKIASGEKLLGHPHWKLFLLTPHIVERMFLNAHRENYLSYQAAGGVIRIEFNFSNLEEFLRGLDT